MNIFKKLFGKKECKVVPSISLDEVLASRLKELVDFGKMKDYEGVKKFIESKYTGNYPELYDMLSRSIGILSTGNASPELQSLHTKWINRWYKCDDPIVDALIRY